MAISNNLPQFVSSAYTSTTPSLQHLGLIGSATSEGSFGWVGDSGVPDGFNQAGRARTYREIAAVQSPIKHEENPMAATRRLVKVVIVDPDDNVPLDQCILYNGSEKLTDATDQELFFEINIQDILSKHNESRVKLVNKKVKERTENLEPVKIRDLKMVVVNIASF